jgi:cystine transport system substrate-binding protein
MGKLHGDNMKQYLFLFILLVLSHHSYAENFIAATANWSPYAMKTEEGITGISVEILNEIVKRTGDTISINIYPTKRLNMLFDSNKLDINFADSPDWNEAKHSQNYIFSEKYFDVKEYVYFLKNRFIETNKPKDLKGKRIGISAGYYYEMFDAYFKRHIIIKKEIYSNKSLLRFLKSGRCDAAFFDNVLFDYLIIQLDFDKKQFKRGFEINNAPLGLKIRIEKRHAVKRFNNAIRTLKKEGFIKKIIHKYTNFYSDE